MTQSASERPREKLFRQGFLPSPETVPEWYHVRANLDSLGLIGMQINMPESGTFLFISDHCHVIENVSQLSLSTSRRPQISWPPHTSMMTACGVPQPTIPVHASFISHTHKLTSTVARRHPARLASPRPPRLVPIYTASQAA